MKDTIKINKGGVEKLLLVDNISSIRITPQKQEKDYLYEPLVRKSYLWGLIKTRDGGYVYDTRYPSFSQFNRLSREILESSGFIVDEQYNVFEKAKITIVTSDGEWHTTRFDTTKQFNAVVEEINKLINMVIEIK